jgi:SecD/SecF fusion protein
MQNKGIIWAFIVLLSLACLYQLSFTWVARSVEGEAKELMGEDQQKVDAYLDSMQSEVVYPIFGFTYGDCKKQELNLGLDLKGGMNVILEISVEDVVRALSSNSEDSLFNAAINEAKRMQRESQESFVVLFGQAFEQLNPNAKLSSVFYTLENKEKISRSATNEEVLAFIDEEAKAAFDRSFEVLRTRVNLFGVAQPNIQKLEGSDRILVELPGVKNKERVRQLLQGTAKLEFWETYENAEIFPILSQVNVKLSKLLAAEEADSEETSVDTSEAEITTPQEDVPALLSDGETTQDDSAAEESLSLIDEAAGDTAGLNPEDALQNAEQMAKDYPLFSIMQPAFFQGDEAPQKGPVVGYAAIKDTGKINQYLSRPEIQAMLPPKLKLLWAAKPYNEEGTFLQLIAVKVASRDGKAPLEGDVIVDAYQGFSQFGGRPEIVMKMNPYGAKIWKAITKEHIGESIAIVLDDYVYSFPTVNEEIGGGISTIAGNFEIEEAQLIANILKAGKLPAPARIVEEAVVGPSLGKEAVSSGLTSFLIALFIVLLYMVFYYSNAGLASNVALLANLFFIVGVLASTNIALTLPGIAGIVLTIGMSVDANVLIYERIREEMAVGKGMRLALSDGYKNAYSSIIDANVTTLLTGCILWAFGSGPIEGFAKTLVIGIMTSLFSAIFITRLIFVWRLDRNKPIRFATKMTEGAFKKMNVRFVGNRKKYYIVSAIIIVAGLGSLFTKGLNYGIDFQGGRTYLVRFEQAVVESDVREALTDVFEGVPEVKTFGTADQVKVTTNFMINSEDKNADQIVEDKLHSGLKAMRNAQDYEIMSSQKVGPTIADDIKSSAWYSMVFAFLAIFIYILFRFRRWQFGLAAVLAIVHDVLVVLSVFSLLYDVLPFSLEIDQAFIAALLTVVGYSINDTVVVFDRIREYLMAARKKDGNEVIDRALNSTLSRTFNTSLSTIFVLLMIFVFGGEVIRGFSFALLVGVVVGTYSSLCVATPLVVDLSPDKLGVKQQQ